MEELEECPFCKSTIPEGAAVCASCGAYTGYTATRSGYPGVLVYVCLPAKPERFPGSRCRIWYRGVPGWSRRYRRHLILVHQGYAVDIP